MADSILEQAIQNAVAVGTAIKAQDGVTALFKLVGRGRPSIQSIGEQQRPALFLRWAVERAPKGSQAAEKTTKRIVLTALAIANAQTDATLLDQQLILLKDSVEKAYSNTVLTGFMGELFYLGSDASMFGGTPEGAVNVAFDTLYVTNRTDPWSNS